MAEFKKCPWTTLGVEKAASEKQIREAYRKMALKHHPDVNKGCDISSRRFQEVKEAFEQIQTMKTSGRMHNAAAAHRRSTQYTRYRYTATPNQTASGSHFYGFRRDRGGRTDFRGKYENGHRSRDWGRGGMDTESFQSVQRRIRIMERTGAGLAVFLVGATVTFAALGSEVLWRANNKGKSFDDLMRNLDKKNMQSERRSGRRRERSKVPDDNKETSM